jgi:hypothetical protein
MELLVELAHVNKLSDNLGVAKNDIKNTLSHSVISIDDFESIFLFFNFLFI